MSAQPRKKTEAKKRDTKKQSEKARIASQKNIDKWEVEQAEVNRISNDEEVKKVAYREGATFGLVLGSVIVFLIAWVVIALTTIDL